jgi:hypothetical protein
MKVSLFGNPDMAVDSLPVELKLKLEKRFPEIDFVVQDPNELDLPDSNMNRWIIIDTVAGLDKVRLVTIDEIAPPETRATVHDFDLASHLLLVKKMNQNIDIQIIGVPMGNNKQTALKNVSNILRQLTE